MSRITKDDLNGSKRRRPRKFKEYDAHDYYHGNNRQGSRPKGKPYNRRTVRHNNKKWR